MVRNYGLMGAVAAGALLTLAACSGEKSEAPAATASTTETTASAAVDPAAVDTATASERAEASVDGNPAGVTPGPEATAGATPADVAAPVSPATAAAAAGGGGVMLAGLTGNATAGQKVFGQCRTCHVVDAGVNKVGPSLNGIIGRPAGTIPGFRYSPANKNSGITWTEDVMFAYLENPRKYIPGTYMSYVGLKDPQQRADVIAYLKTAS